MFEHPTSASSWTTTMMQQMMNLEGVYVSKFDFCQLGMETKGEDGSIMLAKKRTTVLTNSANLAEVLRRAQCQGLHRHQHLINGRAKQCQIYPRRFIELIGDCIQKDIEDAKWRNKIAEKIVGIQQLGEAERRVSGIAATLPQAASPVGLQISYLGSISPVELQESIEALMAAIEKVEPPHEAEGSVKFEKLYAGK